MRRARERGYLNATERWPRLSYGRGWTAWTPYHNLSSRFLKTVSWGARRASVGLPAIPRQPCVTSLCHAQRHYAISSSHTAQGYSFHHHNNDNSSAQVDVDDWSTIEVEVLKPEVMSAAAASSSSYATANRIAILDTEHSPTSSTSTERVQTIDTVDVYAKAKVMNFIRRQQPSQSGGASAAAAAAASSSSSISNTAIPGMEVREVQGTAGDVTQFHARWRLPLPAEYGERFGEGYAPTAKEAENVAAMHAERVIDVLGFPLFLLSSKQRKHAETARAAGRWAMMPPASLSNADVAATEIVPSPETPSPPPLRLLRVSAREQQERQLRIDHIQFTPVEKGVFTPLSCTLATPYYYDPASVRRVDGFFKAHRTRFSRCLRFFLLQGSRTGDTQRRSCQQNDMFLAQLTLPLPPRFGIRVAMGRAATRKDAATLACMHAELIIDAVGFALYPTNHTQQAVHAEECARVRRWCAPPGDCDYRYTVASPAPLELVERLDDSAAAEASLTLAASSAVPIREANAAGQQSPATLSHRNQKIRRPAGEARRTSDEVYTDNADIQVGTTSSGSVESILLQHHHAVAAASYFANEVSLRDYENAQLLLERYLEQFVGLASSDTVSFPSESSPLRSLMFVDQLGQRDRPVFRATITIPLVDTVNGSTRHSDSSDPTAATAASTRSLVKTPLPYTQSFVAIGIADTARIAELAASLHGLRTLASLNRLTFLSGDLALLQALESFAVRGQLPLYIPTRPMLYPADVPVEELPAAVRVMEGVIGRIATSGLVAKAKEARAQVFSPGVVVQSRRGAKKAAHAEYSPHVLNRHEREDFLFKELQLARSRLPRLDWDTTADAEDRIVIAPDADAQTAPQYFHTLSSVRNPDSGVALRIRDYLERHGKTLDMVSATVRVRVSEDAPEEGFMYVTTLALPLPDTGRRRTREQENEGEEREEGETAKKEMETSVFASPHTEMKTCTAQGEGPTRDDSILLCEAHAELLLDALGVPLYDHPQLQCKHADAARALGRWAPLVRGALLAPTALRPLPPPLRKVTKHSALWAQVQRERHAEAAKVRREGSTNMNDGAAAAGDAAPTNAMTTADGDVDDGVLCDIERLRFVHSTEIFYNSVRYAARFFSSRGLDFYRAVRQYKVHHPKYGVIHRAIVELPTPAVYGKRYAVGLADSKRQALQLCAQHTVHILDALHIPVLHSKVAQSRYAQKGAIKGQRVPLPSEGRAGPTTRTPPGYYCLELSEAAGERPLAIPVCPTVEAAEEELVWKTYVQRCAAYQLRWTTYVVKKAVSASPVPGAPRSNVPVEDATLDMAEAAPLEPYAGKQLRDLCNAAGLPNPLADRIVFENVKLSTEKRVFVTTCALHGTPYTMRGFSSESGQESRTRAYMHGIQLVEYVVRANSKITATTRRGWAEGMDRCVSMLDSLKGEITHHGRVWVLRMWSAMHSPPRSLQVVVHAETTKCNGAPSVRSSSANADTASQTWNTNGAPYNGNTTTPSLAEYDETAPAAADEGRRELLNELSYYAAVSIVEGGGTKTPRIVLKKLSVAHGFNGVAAVKGAVHKVFFQLQRTPTMQALLRFLSHQPQLHLPSLRILRDPDGVVRQLPRALAPLKIASIQSDKEPTTTQLTPRDGVSCADVAAPFLPSDGAEDSFLTLPTYSTWPVEVLQRWVRAYSSTKESTPADRHLPCTLAPLFEMYGLVRKEGGFQRNSGECAPSRLAGALALLYRCLPSLPNVSVGASNAVTRDRALPLQLAHMLLMGLLLDCAPWAVRLVAMVVRAEETLTWYREATRLSSSPSMPEPHTPASHAANTMWSCMSVDVVEALLLSLDPATTRPPLPTSVESYARAVSQRLKTLLAGALNHTEELEANLAETDDTDGDARPRLIDAAWLRKAAALRTSTTDGNEDGVTMLKTPSMQETRKLRSLLQCSVVASVAPQEVWVRAGRVEENVRNYYKDEGEDGEGDDKAGGVAPTSEELFVFQGRRSAPFAALYVNGTDLTRTDVDSMHTLSSTAACFAAFGCTVEPGVKSPSTADASSTSSSAFVKLPSSVTPKVAEDVGKDEGEENDADDEDERPMHAQPIDPACFTRLLGTCVTPLAAVIVGQDTPLSFSESSQRQSEAATDFSALRFSNEDLPMLTTAFQDTVPLLVHDGESVSALIELGAHFRSRIAQLQPFTEAERKVLCQLLSLPVEAVREDGIDDG